MRRSISIDSIILTEPDLALEKSEDDKNNWTFPKKEGEQQSSSGWGFDINELTIRQGNVRYLDPVKKADAKVRIDTGEDGTTSFRLGGTFNDEPLSGGGKTGSLLALRQTKVRYPVQAVVKVGETTISADGTLTGFGADEQIALQAEHHDLTGLRPRQQTKEGTIIGTGQRRPGTACVFRAE